ncbi:esterase-like activity of phytase family protein [Microcoleus sp. FACHB-831]|uniref:esterase-like activity of phytase family protein n=1 Tax=Microcoleus sp. FACHB-831 TaxID=2692827 RepID=UPI0016874113|nr:esterase-like activity of phytase family protein [Microcoleus sp. FACHB-831]MBD1923982.1 esterase-like activity of phytase family protein [Microcoleus sp. FACHB-831]
MNRIKFRISSWLIASAIAALTFLTSCALPRVDAAQRTFLDISLEFLGEYQMPKAEYKDTPVGGLSGLTYDRQRNLFYAVSDDHSELAPARFYTLKLILNTPVEEKPSIQKVEVQDVTYLGDENGNTIPEGTVDTEAIALSPQQSVFISSEGIASKSIPPFVNEFDLKTGKLRQSLPIPKRYIPDAPGENQRLGIQNNFAFESLTLNPTGTIPAKGEPFRLFAATESALVQDKDPVTTPTKDSPKQQGAKCRLLHYLLSDGPPVLISEHVYQLEPRPSGSVYHGLTELLALDQGGHFLSLERSFGLLGFNARIFQAATGGATDTSSIASLKGNISSIQPVKKKLLLDLNQLGIALDNLEGMTLGPRLPDGSQSLLVVSDNNFDENQVTQFLLFRLNSNR